MLYRKIKKLFKLINIVKLGLLPVLLKTRVAAGVEHRSLLLLLNCNHIVDIGANRGQFALIARKCFPDTRIDSFEPLSEAADCFQVVFDNDRFIHLHRLAIGKIRDEVIIHISQSEDSSSLLPITNTQSELFPGTEECDTRIINVVPLHDVLSEHDILDHALLKIDVQGFEMEVLQGCEGLLDRFRYIYVECSFIELYAGQAFADEVIALLQKRNFVLDGIYNLCYDKSGRAIQGDFLFKRKN